MGHAEGRGGTFFYEPDGSPTMIRQVTWKKLKYHINSRFGTDLFSDAPAWFRRAFTGSCLTKAQKDDFVKKQRSNSARLVANFQEESQRQTSEMLQHAVKKKLADPNVPQIIKERLKAIK